MMGYAASAVGQPLNPITYEPPELGLSDVRVKVTHCGLCYTDIQAIDEFFDIKYNYPFVPGHEIVGFVSHVGSAVNDLKVGDRVGIGWQGRSCMQCEWCLKGEDQLCIKIADMGTWHPYGGFSDSVVVDHRFAYPLTVGMPSETAAVLMCAGISVYTPLRAYSAESTTKIAILGVGGLGHLAIQFAHALNYEVTVISSSSNKQEQAFAFGADHFMVSSDRSEITEHEFAFDLLLCTAVGKVVWNPLIDVVKKEGRIVVLGFVDLEMNPTDMVAHNLSITGSFLGNRATMREMLAFAQANHITPMVEIMPMSQVNEAIQRVRENNARYRIVLVNEPGRG
jgi:uncharacterized zinc-type alcohol dehydrogenase-like protein